MAADGRFITAGAMLICVASLLAEVSASAFMSTPYDANLEPQLPFPRSRKLLEKKQKKKLRAPTMILFVSHDTCNDSIEKLSRACFYGFLHRCACVKLSARRGGGIPPFWGSANLPENIAAIVSQYRMI